MTDSIVSKFNDLYQVGSDEIDLRNPDLNARQAGSVNDAYLGASAAIGDEVVFQTLTAVKDTFFGTAEGDALDTLAWDHLRLERIAATKSVGTLLLERPTTDGGNVTISIGTQFATTAIGSDAEVVFETTETVVMTGLSVSVSAQAYEGGTSGNVSAETIDVVKTTLSDSTITVTNEDAFVGGSEEETDENFRDRIAKYQETLRRGTKDAVEFGALNVGGVYYSNLDESTAGDGYITLYITDQDGNSNADLEAAVLAEIENYYAAGVTVNVDGATKVTQNIVMALSYEAGVDTEAVRLLAEEAAADYRDSLNVGETLYHSALSAAIQSVEGLAGAVVTTPAGNVVPSANQIIRGGTVTTS